MFDITSLILGIVLGASLTIAVLAVYAALEKDDNEY